VQGKCPATPYHATVFSGTGSTVGGTAQGTTTPAQWSVNGSTGDVWAQAAFIQGPVLSDGRETAIEAGFFSGQWPYNLTQPFQNGLIPYYTVNNGDGTGQGDNLSTSFGPSTSLGLFAWSAGLTSTPAFAHAGGTAFNLGNYTVQAPRTNMGQGEVHTTTSTWMGGGSGETSNGYWSSDGGNWYLWGYFSSACVDSPYWLTENNGAYQWTDGGY
jgi:hypothetical protein